MQKSDILICNHVCVSWKKHIDKLMPYPKFNLIKYPVLKQVYFSKKTLILIYFSSIFSILTPVVTRTTDALFHQNPKLLGLGRQFGQTNFKAFAVILANLSIISTHFGTVSPLSIFSLINRYFFLKAFICWLSSLWFERLLVN